MPQPILVNSDGEILVSISGAGTGNVFGPASSTDNAVARFDGTTGELLQNSTVLIGDTGAITGVLSITGVAGGSVITGGTGSGDDLTLRSTTNGTKGDVFIADQGGNVIIGGGATASRLRLLEPSGSGSNYTEFFTQAQSANISYTLPATVGAAASYLKDVAGDGVLSWATIAAGGDVSGPGSSTDNALVRFDSTSGKVIQDSDAILDDSENLTGLTSVTVANNGIHILDTNASHDLILAVGSDLSADRILTLTTGDAARTVTLSGNLTVAADASVSGILVVASGKTFTVNQTITLIGTDAQSYTFPTTSATLARTDAGNTFTGVSTASAWVLTSPTITTKLNPTSDDGAPLGDTTHNWSDLFLATGALINYANGNVVLTHSSGILTMTTGDLRVTSANVGTNADSVPTLSSTSTLTNKTLTSPTLTTPSAFTTGGTITLAENTAIALDPAGSADGKYTGITVTATAGYSQAFGDLVYLDPTDSRWEATDANAAAGADGDARGLLGMVVVAGTDGNACTILLSGIIRADAKFPTFTVNNPIYVSETAGEVTNTQPTTTDVVIRIVGAGLNGNEMYFNPDWAWITHI